MSDSVRRPPPRRPHRAPGTFRRLRLRLAVAAGAALTVGAAIALPQADPANAVDVTRGAAPPLAGLLHPHPTPGPVSSSATPTDDGTSTDPTDGTVDNGTLDDNPVGDGSPGDGSFALVADTAEASALAGNGIPRVALDAYRRAADAAPSSCGIDWSLLAAIGRVESNHGRFAGAVLHSDGVSTPRILGPVLDGRGTALVPDTDGGRLDGNAVYDRAVGPMQFIPSTWARYAADGNGDGVKDPFNVFDAARAAAHYLCAAGAHLTTPDGQARAVFAYNHSDTYVSTVLGLAAFYAGVEPDFPGAFSQPAIEPVNPAPPPALGEPSPSDSPSAPPTSTPPTTPPPTTTPPTTPPPTTTPPTTPPPTTTPPTTPPPPATPPTTTPPATPPTTTPPTTPPTTTPPAGSCPAVPTGLVIDVVDDTGRTGVADRVASDLRAGGITVGTVTRGTGAAASAIEFPVARQARAQQFAGAIDATAYLLAAQVPRITVVLGPAGGATALLTALDRFTACTASTTPAG